MTKPPWDFAFLYADELQAHGLTQILYTTGKEAVESMVDLQAISMTLSTSTSPGYGISNPRTFTIRQ